MKTLTASGAGVIADIRGLNEEARTKYLLDLISKHRFVVIKHFSDSLDDALALMGSFGPLNDAPTRDKGVLKLDTSQENEVLRSHEALPLHKDGLLTAYDVAMVGIFCMEFKNVNGGRTYIADTSTAVNALPAAHLNLLKTVGFEGLPVDDTGYYARDTAKWHPFKAFVPGDNGEDTLHIGMPHLPGEKEGWKVRIPSVGQEESDEIFYNMIRIFSNPPYVYFHDWEEGDIVIFDNYKVLHGREAFSGGPRELANIQVVR
jgi:alpha-ketoglutarate-dependent taurine dioxygenase